MRRTLALAIVFSAFGVSLAHAEEPVGCDKFKWPIDQARTALNAPGISRLQSGDELAPPASAAIVGLLSLTDAGLPRKPERSPKPETFAGFVTVTSVKAGRYILSLSDAAWVDMIQDGIYLKPKAFSGATGCEGIRKTIKFDLSATPLTIQVSGVARNTIHLALQPATD